MQSYCMIDERTDIWSLGCVLYAICFFKCPYDVIYEKGDSVALAVLSGNVVFPRNSPYSDVNKISIALAANWGDNDFFVFSLTQEMHNLIAFMLRINPMERPYVYSVLEAAHSLIGKLEGRV